MFDAASIAVSRRSRRVETDWIDVETLLRTLSGGARGKRRISSWCGHRGKHFTLSVAETDETVVSLRKMDCPRGPLTWPDVAEAGSPLRRRIAPSYVCPVRSIADFDWSELVPAIIDQHHCLIVAQAGLAATTGG